MDVAMKVLGHLYGHKEEIATELFEYFKHISGEMYLGYPIYINEITHAQISVDIAIISKKGNVFINLLDNPVVDYTELQDALYAKIEAKLKKCPYLYKHRKLAVDFQVITYCKGEMSVQPDCPLATNIQQLIDEVGKCLNNHYSDDVYEKVLSGIQEAYGISRHTIREDVAEGTKAHAIQKASQLVERYGDSQMEAILSDVSGIQRIRGMAGSGKTIVLARKVAELHTAHPEWTIVVTYYTRSLKKQLQDLIGKFYASKNDGAKYDSSKIKIMQAWGSSNSRGLYYEICLEHDKSPMNYQEAKSAFPSGRLFDNVCEKLLDEVTDFHKMYDCILIDEAQDFGKSFFKMCSRVLDAEQRLVYAYDELQTLDEIPMPSPEELFGHPLNYDTPLVVCYRNQGPVIVTAHALGMGLYRKEGIVQMPNSADVWAAIGYFANCSEFEGNKVTLYRTKETSPDFLDVSTNDIIDFCSFEDEKQMWASLLEQIENDIKKEMLLHRDIMIIDMDTLGHANNHTRLARYQFDCITSEIDDFEEAMEAKLHIHLAGASSPEDFFRDNSVVYTSVRRAKGNEAYMVYIINAHKCIRTVQRRADRNALFTAITRSKGWVRVLGYGTDMDILCNEFQQIKNHDYKLCFDPYPTKEEQAHIFMNNRDVKGKDKQTLDQTKAIIDRLTRDGQFSTVQIIQQLLDCDIEELKRLLDGEDEKV